MSQLPQCDAHHTTWPRLSGYLQRINEVVTSRYATPVKYAPSDKDAYASCRTNVCCILVRTCNRKCTWKSYCCVLADINDLYAFHYTASDIPNKQIGWDFYDEQSEYMRMGVPNQHWVRSNINKDYEVSTCHGHLSFSRGTIRGLVYLLTYSYSVSVLQLASQHIQRLQNTHLFQFDRSPSEPHPLATSSWIYMYMYCKLNIKSVQTVFECVHGYWRKRYINGIVNDFRRNWTLWKLLSIKRWASVTSGIDQLWVSLLRHRKQPVVLSCS